MSDLRNRSPVLRPAEPAFRPEKSRDHNSPSPKAQAQSKSSLITAQRVLWACSVSLAALYFIFLHARESSLRDTYAVCSKEGPNIYTVDPANPRVQCLVVDGKTILDTGSFEEVQRRWLAMVSGRQSNMALSLTQLRLPTHFIDTGAIIVPGLSDSHAHMLEYGASRLIPLESAKTAEAAATLVKEYILSDPDILRDKEKIVMGWGWDHTRWEGQQFPTAAALDADPIVRNRRVVLQSKDGHALWVNGKVLKEMYPLPGTVEGGFIIRDEAGNPTGCLIDNAQLLVPVPPPTQADLEKQFRLVVDDALSFGLTSIHDAGFDPKSLEFFKGLAEENRLPIRIYGMTYFDENAPYWGNLSKPIIGAADGRFTARSVKIFADGALRSGGSALFEPYTDNPSTRGLMRTDPSVLRSFIPRFLADEWQVNVHAIGDRANAIVLDAFEEALQGANVTALRPRIEHAQMVRHVDMARMGKIGVIASIQPTHAPSDMYFAEDRLGPERVKLLYAFRSMIDNGARIALGSDGPVETINPLAGFYAAITRLAPDGTSTHGPDGWFPEQRLTREEALKGMTLDAAYASFTESTLGSLTPGKRADFTVLSKDIMEIPASEILATEVLTTAIDGKPAYGKF
ncbi:uncharacterized protein STEHIDRAFT_102473 [Stereum hirsutum FP-91666 SS1]|uniref:uncharacterized protein n=1 Tax=Stereum hirsutum (strain FP-91666) TaxID=721885 RepID=UPI000444A162|nr:uncharacterized protein STEHIDRAFT_102473 [Stereum hirsutum FP-91666 SS1]EIM82980.1 hypothetical protein STEHIDRAFT_102473 [Stereum hirsutum FP-91666 SS1]